MEDCGVIFTTTILDMTSFHPKTFISSSLLCLRAYGHILRRSFCSNTILFHPLLSLLHFSQIGVLTLSTVSIHLLALSVVSFQFPFRLHLLVQYFRDPQPISSNLLTLFLFFLALVITLYLCINMNIHPKITYFSFLL